MGPKKTSANSGDDLVQGVPEEPVVPGPNQAPEDLQADVKGLKEVYKGHQQLLEVLLQQQARISEQMEQLLNGRTEGTREMVITPAPAPVATPTAVIAQAPPVVLPPIPVADPRPTPPVVPAAAPEETATAPHPVVMPPSASTTGEAGAKRGRTYGFEGIQNPQLVPLFRDTARGGDLPWDRLRVLGYLPPTCGWGGHIPKEGALGILEPYWAARQGYTLGYAAQEGLWPQLVATATPAELGKSKNPHALFTSLEGFVKGFMSAAANAGPGLYPGRDNGTLPVHEWHHEASLARIARRGLMRHPVVHAALESANEHSSLRDLFEDVEKALRLDTKQEWVRASAAMSTLQLTELSTTALLELRAKFQELALKLRHRSTDAELCQDFRRVLTRKPGTPESFVRFILDELSGCSTWEEQWDRLNKLEQTTTLGWDMRVPEGGNPVGTPARRVLAAPPPRLHHIQSPMGEAEQAYVDLYDEEGYVTEEEVEEQMAACFHMAGPPLAKGMRRPLPPDAGVLGNLRGACHTCGGQGHFSSDCTAWNKETDEVTMPRARATAAFRLARGSLYQQGQMRANGQALNPAKLP